MRLLIPLVFLALAAHFVLDARRPMELSIPAASGVTRADLHLGPPRAVLADPPTIQNGPFRQTCNECHRIFPPRDVLRSPPLQHAHVVLAHGLNDRCTNCHAREDRDRLALQDGRTLAFAEVARVCAQCHGTLYRDWQLGAHGRTSGHWDRAAGPAERLTCTQCHDPHAPAFPPLAPLAGPNTLRMGRQERGEPPGEPENPLERWKAPRRSEAPFRPAHEEEEELP